MGRTQLLTILYLLAILYALWTLYGFFGDSQPTSFLESRECILKATRTIKSDDQLWKSFPDIVNDCSIQHLLNVKGFANTDELKYHVMPKKNAFSSSNHCTIVSLGIGKDVDAEKSMQEAMPSCNFFGADPVNETNAELFPEVGKFFNIAVGAKNGTFRSYILEDIYRYQEVKYVDIVTFIRKYVKRTIIDQLMVDVEHAEYPMLPFFLKKEGLAQDGMTICQMNIEIHRPNEKQKAMFANFFKRIMKEKQWAFMSTSTIIGHLRLYMVNYGSQECRTRYFDEVDVEGDSEKEHKDNKEQETVEKTEEN